MAKLLVVEGSNIVKGVFKDLLDSEDSFEYELAGTYEEAKALLEKTTYEYAVVERVLSDAPNGEIIALLNKHNVAPLLFTKEIDENFFESFEGAKLVEYILKHKYNNVTNVIEKLKQLQKNKQITVLIASDSNIYNLYLKQNLNLHSFKVLSAANNVEVLNKMQLHPEISFVILDAKSIYLDPLEIIKKIRYYKKSNQLKILQIVTESNSFQTSTLLSAGADDFIVKPFSRHEFYTRIYQNIQNISLSD
jgi:putative two-component system response regulator